MGDEFLKQFTSFDRNGRNRRNKKEFMRNGKGKGADDDGEEATETKQKKKRRRRRKDKKEKNENSKDGQRGANGTANGAIESKCKACEATFGSKTKLYDHLKLFPKHALKSQH